MTDAERRLWYLLRDRRLGGIKFRRQVPVGPYIADFLSYEHRLVIEVDGSKHVDSQRDERRDAWLTHNGFRVLRFWNNEVLTSPEGVFEALQAALQQAPPRPAPAAPPSPAREEGRADGDRTAGRPAVASATERAAAHNMKAPAPRETSPLAGEGGPSATRGPGEGAKQRTLRRHADPNSGSTA